MSEMALEKESTTRLGFWIYLMTDCMLFATLFATYGVLHTATSGGSGAKELFDLPYALVETIILLISSALSGIMYLAFKNGKYSLGRSLLIAVLLLGATFVSMELYEFSKLVSEGNSWQASAFLSSFFTLVATHGLHISVGILWGSLLFIRLRKGVDEDLLRKMGLFTVFWHFLDVVWIFIFTFVYLAGGLS